jgi:hypothetical protein
VNLKELVINKTAKFAYCTDGALWYEVDGFRFPVPFSETVGACFMSEHKAINLMAGYENNWKKMPLNTKFLGELFVRPIR